MRTAVPVIAYADYGRRAVNYQFAGRRISADRRTAETIRSSARMEANEFSACLYGKMASRCFKWLFGFEVKAMVGFAEPISHIVIARGMLATGIFGTPRLGG